MTDIIMVLLKNVLATRSDIKVQYLPSTYFVLKYCADCTLYSGEGDISENSGSGSIYDPEQRHLIKD